MDTGNCKFWFLDCFSVSDILILRSSFDSIVDSWENIGLTAFTNLFEVNPAAFQVFIKSKVLIPQTKGDVAYSWETKQHSMRIIHAIQRCLSRLDKKEAFSQFVMELAAKHSNYGVTPDFIVDLVGCLQAALFNEFGRLAKRGKSSPLLSDSFLAVVESLSGIDGENIPNNKMPHQPDIDWLLLKITQPWSKFFSVLSLALIRGIWRSTNSSPTASTSSVASLGGGETTPRSSSSCS